MSQPIPRFCPRCGTSVAPDAARCTNCGLEFRSRAAQTNTSAAFTRFQMSTSSPARKKFSRRSIVLLSALLLVLVLAIGYISLILAGVRLPSFGSSGQPSITSFPVQATLPFEGITITVNEAQQAQNFLDDPTTVNTRPDDMVRILLHAQNTSTTLVDLNYMSNAFLATAPNELLSPTYVRGSSGIASGTTQANVIDFVTSEHTLADQLQLVLGKKGDAQLIIPLQKNPDMSAYNPVITKVSDTTVYQGLNWTLLSATTQYSIVGSQALNNMRYLVISLQVDNTLSQTAIPGSAYDYMRLQATTISLVPQNSTLPVSFASGENGQTGTVTFLIPQKSTALALTFLAQNQNGFTQAAIDFKLA